MTNTDMLKEKIRSSGLRLGYIIDKLGIAYPTFKRKLNNESEFTASEIVILSQLLSLSDNETKLIFLAEG